MTNCDRCFRSLANGEHGEGLCPLEPRAKAHAIITDDIPGGQIFENGLPEPRRFYSHSEHRKALAEHGCEIRAKWAGPNDKIMSRWDTVNLEAAAELLTRGAQARKAQADRMAEIKREFPITVTDVRYDQ